MSPIDPTTFGTKSPRTLDGRNYPEHLRPFEAFDDALLPLVAQSGQVTFDELSMRVDDPKMRSLLPRWIASAEWRGLIERQDVAHRGPLAYGLGPQAAKHLPHAAQHPAACPTSGFADRVFLTAKGTPKLIRCAVLFVDFLGVRAMNRAPLQEMRESLVRLEEAVSNMYRDYLKPESPWPASFFSDTLVLASPILRREDEGSAIEGLVLQAARLQLNLVSRGFFVRGGLSLGWFHIRNGLIFGPALAEAYELESCSTTSAHRSPKFWATERPSRRTCTLIGPTSASGRSTAGSPSTTMPSSTKRSVATKR